jgi:site-specific recombinase
MVTQSATLRRMPSSTAAEPISVDSAPPDPGALTTRHAGRVKPRDLKALHRWLTSLPDTTRPGSFEAATAALDAGARWVRSNSALLDVEPPQVVRLRLLVDVLAEVPTWRRALGAVVARVCTDGDALPALESGLPNDRGLWPESADRLSRRFLPAADAGRDLGALVSRLFPTMRDAAWLEKVPADVAGPLARALVDGARAANEWSRKRGPSPETVAAAGVDQFAATEHGAGPLEGRLSVGAGEPGRTTGSADRSSSRTSTPALPPGFAIIDRALLDAVALIATRTSALGLSREIRARSPEVELAASPFFLLPRLCDALFTGIGSIASCRDQIAACREAQETVRTHLEEFGVSVDVVYRLEVIGHNLDRLAELLAVAGATDVEERGAASFAMLASIAAARVRHRSLRDIFATNMHLLARKMIEHAGQTGEHYITTTRGQWWKMLASAAGGGFLTGFTIILKYLVLWSHFPLFVEGALASANYAGSFLTMQLCGFTLATKQPSMIAAALAGSLHRSRDKVDAYELDDLVTLIARICRSQLAAAIGNVGMVIPTAVAFHFAYLHFRGVPFLDEEAARHTIESFHPLHSGTIFFAALTGVLLWMSSLGAGWVENWSTYRRLPEAIATHRLGRIIGRRPMRWMARIMARNVAGVGGNISIGVLLGMVPVVGRFFGIPLEVRHVTLSTGSLALAGCSVGIHEGFWAAAIGVLVILALNFGVSFTCAIFVALRARGVAHAGRRLLRAVLSRFVRGPLPFLVPVGSDAS